MNKQAVVSKFSHVKPSDTEFKGGGLRDFFLYRDLANANLREPWRLPMNKQAVVSKFSQVKPGDTEFKTVDVPPFVHKVPPPTPWK